MSAIEEFAYVKLIAAMKGLASGKNWNDNVVADVGRKFEIIKILLDAQTLQGSFADDHVDQVKAAFAKRGLTYPGNDIASCVKALLANGTQT